MHGMDYTFYEDAWGKGNAFDLFVSLHGLCGVMGIHIHILLVDTTWGMSKVLWCIDEMNSKYAMLTIFSVWWYL